MSMYEVLVWRHFGKPRAVVYTIGLEISNSYKTQDGHYYGAENMTWWSKRGAYQNRGPEVEPSLPVRPISSDLFV